MVVWTVLVGCGSALVPVLWGWWAVPSVVRRVVATLPLNVTCGSAEVSARDVRLRVESAIMEMVPLTEAPLVRVRRLSPLRYHVEVEGCLPIGWSRDWRLGVRPHRWVIDARVTSGG